MSMPDGFARTADELEQLSALLDGEVAGDAAARSCARWRDDAQMRSTWHRWLLIGDVLRSDDLASTPAHDERFLQALRDRLADEPVVLAPQPLAATVSSRRRSKWLASSAVAAGFVVVAGAVLVLREPAAPPAPVAAVRLPPPLPAADADPQAMVANAALIRDARLDRYLAAHKQFAGSSALGVPSGYLRAATADAPAR